MATLHERFSGLFIPHVTPFDEAGAVDESQQNGRWISLKTA